MADVFSKAKRSEVMSRIRSRGNKDTELALAGLLRAHGITGWRRQIQIRGRARNPLRAAGGASVRASRLASSLAPPKTGAHGVTRPANARTSQQRRPAIRVRPDFVFQKLKLTVFVDGCFWHGCPKHATWPAHRAAWWRRKIESNRARDRRVNRTLRGAGWRVIRIWEHELARKAQARLVRRIERAANPT